MKIAGVVSAGLSGALFYFTLFTQEPRLNLNTPHCELKSDGRWCDGTSDQPGGFWSFEVGPSRCQAPPFAPPALMRRVKPFDGVEWHEVRNNLSGLGYLEYMILRGPGEIRVTHGFGLYILVLWLPVLAPILIWLGVFAFVKGRSALKKRPSP